MTRDLTPKADDMVKEESEKMGRLKSCMVSANTAIVTSDMGAFSKDYTVNLGARTCSCGFWQEHLLPCSHGLRVITAHLRVDPIGYIDEMYYSSTYQKMYDVTTDGNVQIITLDDLYEMTTQLNLEDFALVPPEPEPHCGRKLKNRIESQTIPTKVEKEAKARRRQEQQRKCTVCGRSGHVAARCPNKKVAGPSHSL
jgi:SWIM zinc finger